MAAVILQSCNTEHIFFHVIKTSHTKDLLNIRYYETPKLIHELKKFFYIINDEWGGHSSKTRQSKAAPPRKCQRFISYRQTSEEIGEGEGKRGWLFFTLYIYRNVL